MADEAAERNSAPVGARVPLLASLGLLVSAIDAALTFLGECAILAFDSIATALTGGIAFRDLVAQLAAVGADSIWIVLIITGATGAVFAYYTTVLAQSVGFTQVVGGSIAYGFLNELGPVLGGVALAARAGAEIAAEIGTMVVTEQVDALRAMAVSPIRYLVAPRVIAALVMLPILTLVADVTGLMGGLVFAGLRGVPSAQFWQSVQYYTEPSDLFRGLVKSVVFGGIVGIVACQQGLRTSGGASGVGRSTTSSVVRCVVIIFLTDMVLTQVLTQRVMGK